MFRKTVFKLILIAITLNTTSAIADNPEKKGLQLAVQAKQRDSGWKDTQSKVVMTLTDNRGRQRVRELRIKSMEIDNDGDKSLFFFQAPKDIRGSAFLSFSHVRAPDEQWLYLPALKRIKRIASNNKSGSFMGSEFAYEDLSSFEVDKYNYRYMSEEPCQGGLCHIIEQRPVYKNSGYYRRVIWQDDSHSRIWKIDYYDHNNKLLKTLHCSHFAQYQEKYWRPGVLSMKNHQTGKGTTLVYEAYQFNTGLRDSDFHKNILQRID